MLTCLRITYKYTPPPAEFQIFLNILPNTGLFIPPFSHRQSLLLSRHQLPHTHLQQRLRNPIPKNIKLTFRKCKL